MASYLYDPAKPLVALSKRDHWTIEDAFAGTHIFGGNGSGKTTGSGQTIARAFLRAGFGGLILCAKPDEAQNWLRYARATGRSKHVIHVRPEAPWRFNFIQYELRRPGDPASRIENIVTTLMNLLEQTGRQQGQQDRFWQTAAEQLLRNTMLVLGAARHEFSLFDVQLFIDAIPESSEMAAKASWLDSDQGGYLTDARAAYEAAGRAADYDAIHHYFANQFPALNSRTRSSVVFTLSAMLQDLLVGTTRELFATGSNFFPEDSHEGALIILDLPASLTRANAAAQTLFKVVWQTAALRRMAAMPRRARPIFLWADEAHFFVSDHDQRFQSLARAARCATVFLTQNLSAYVNLLGSHQAEAAANALIGLFQTQIFHAQTDPMTIRYAQHLIGQTTVTRRNKNYSVSYGTSLSDTHSDTRSTTLDGPTGFSDTNTLGWSYTDSASRTRSAGYSEHTAIEPILHASDLTALSTGSDHPPPGQSHLKGIAQAWIVRAGRRWSHGDTHLLAHFARNAA